MLFMTTLSKLSFQEKHMGYEKIKKRHDQKSIMKKREVGHMKVQSIKKKRIGHMKVQVFKKKKKERKR